MKVGLIGFGRAGKAVASVILESKNHSLEWVLRKTQKLEHRSVPEFLGIESKEPGLIYSINEFTAEELLKKHPVDVIVDFSSAEGIDYYGEAAKIKGIIILSAISHYPEEKIKYLKKLSEFTKVLHSPNITVGINFLIIAAKVLKKIAPYTDIQIIEEHFKDKLEVSGTAKIIASRLGLDETAIKTVRAGGIIGVHEILFGFPYQTVRLKHESITREAFGNGILFAIENINKFGNGLYNMEDLLIPYFEEESKAIKTTQKLKKPWWKFW